jgi:hypothetical protein
MLILKRHIQLAFPLLLMCGCLNSTEPEPVTSCNGGDLYTFYIYGNSLLAGGNHFSLTDPANPIALNKFSLGDTILIIDSTEQYSFEGSAVIPAPIGSSNFQPEIYLPFYPRHVAFANGILYALRHKNSVPNTDFCSDAYDSVNELDVAQIIDSASLATLLDQIPLTNPTDIAINDNILFVLDASTGLEIFSLSNPTKPSLIAQASNVQGFHIQTTPQNTLLVTSSSGLMQYDVSNPNSVTLLSKIQ